MNQNLVGQLLLLIVQQPQHGRALAQELKLPQTTVQRALTALVHDHVLDQSPQGKNYIYTIKNTLVAKQFVYQAEHQKLIMLLQKYPFLEPLFQDIIQRAKSKIIILFGSYAKFSPKSNSDIDIYINASRALAPLQELHSKLSIKTGPLDTSALLIKEIMSHHVIIRGVEEYYDEIGFFEKII